MANATTRAKRLNETKMILRQPLLLIAILLSFALLLLFVIYPLAKTLIYSLTDETGAFSLANLITILQTPRYGKVFGRTMALGLIVAVIMPVALYVAVDNGIPVLMMSLVTMGGIMVGGLSPQEIMSLFQ